MLSFINMRGTWFEPAPRRESRELLDNPGRGWYRIYTFHPGQEAVYEPVRYEGETLALVLIDIGAFRDSDLSGEVLDTIAGILESFAEKNLDMILRICYDSEGKGMGNEPSLFSQVQRHVAQLAPLLVRYAEHIYVFQGLLVGKWGEMHESRYLSGNSLKGLLHTFLTETGGKVRIAFRKPLQYRLVSEQEVSPHAIGFFNDGMLGSETHLGTFAPETSGRGQWQEMWGGSEEIRFMKPFIDKVPYGGEALQASEPLSPEDTDAVLRALRVSYLNSTHEERLLTQWKNTSFGGQSLYDHVGHCMGYRLFVTRIEWKKGRVLRLTVENRGYGPLYESVSCCLYSDMASPQRGPALMGESEENLQGIREGQSRVLTWRLGRQEFPKNARILVRMYRKRDNRPVWFAQEYEGDYLVLGTVRRVL